MKSKSNFDKLRGGYYTPRIITDFISNWAINTGTERLLEPSCGDGGFLYSIAQRFKAINAVENIDELVTGVEVCKEEAVKAEKYGTKIVCSDFFEYYKTSIADKKNYDVIVGNPPFIRYQDFDEKSRELAFEFMKAAGFHPTKLTNIWLPFLVLSSLALNENGKLGMVIPAELFQVNYAAEARKFLAEYFERLTLVTFQKLVFEEIQQEVILLLVGGLHKD